MDSATLIFAGIVGFFGWMIYREHNFFRRAELNTNARMQNVKPKSSFMSLVENIDTLIGETKKQEHEELLAATKNGLTADQIAVQLKPIRDKLNTFALIKNNQHIAAPIAGKVDQFVDSFLKGW